MIQIFSVLLIIVPVLINVAFLTLMERKILALSQSRKGPNKVSFIGILQPISDAIKLFMKELVFPFKSNFMLFYLSPLLGFILTLWMWTVMAFFEEPHTFLFSFMLLLLIMSMSSYSLLLSGWASNSSYALMGALRGMAQTVSYEISMAMLLLSLLVIMKTLKIKILAGVNNKMILLFVVAPIFLMWLPSCMAETNRTPFDFAEGESELVSGFNLEYSGAMFAIIFMSEYSSILFLSLLTTVIFLSMKINTALVFFWMTALSFVWIWVRATFPRYRYDKLMNLAWKWFLPISMSLIVFFLSVVI